MQRSTAALSPSPRKKMKNKKALVETHRDTPARRPSVGRAVNRGLSTLLVFWTNIGAIPAPLELGMKHKDLKAEIT